MSPTPSQCRNRTIAVLSLTFLCCWAAATPAHAQGRPDPAALIAAQREAMGVFAKMDGVWRGPAWSVLPSGEKHEVTQTERIGPFLDGSVKVMEGRGYDVSGKVTFNALGILSYDPNAKTYSLHSYAMGQSGDFVFKPTATGYTWEIPAGPMTIRYEATIQDGVLHEVGDRVMPGKDPMRIFEMTLKRVGENEWPAAGAIPMK